MGTDTFRRHTRACVDTAIHRVFRSLGAPSRRASFFDRLLMAVRQRSDLMTHAPTLRGDLVQVDALRNFLAFQDNFIRPPEDWAGMTGHPLAVLDSLARHVFARYPTPRFLASAWFGGGASARAERRRWFIAHAQGQRFRSLQLPLTMTRQMEHWFLRTPAHLGIDAALRRAEVLGLGGTPELADAVLTTPLADDFAEPDLWRVALRWLVGCGESVELNEVRSLVDYLRANLHTVDLRGRTFESAMRLVRDWHAALARARGRLVCWPRSRWNGMVVDVDPTPVEPRSSCWTIVELVNSYELLHEGRVMRHCVASYTRACVSAYSSIWSLRHRWEDEDLARSVLTIEVRPRTATIVQLRGVANSRPSGWPLDLVRRWATRERLGFDRSIAIGDGLQLPRAA